MSGSIDWERDVYAKGQQLNHWPFSSVVSAFHGHLAQWEGSRRPKVLEVGCGAGNNLWGLAELGFDVHGIELSETAVNFARKKLREHGLGALIEVGVMTDLPYEDESFDFVLDRGGMSVLALNEVPKVVGEAHRVLRNPGIFQSFTLFGEDHPDKRSGVLLENGSRDFFTDGFFQGSGMVSFFSEDSLRQLFMQHFAETTITRIRSTVDGKLVSEEYSVLARK